MDTTGFASMSDEEIAKKLAAGYKKEESRKYVTENKFPTEIIDLPSKGLLYPEGSPLRKGHVEMKYMTALEEDILSSGNLIQRGVVLEKLLESLIVTEGVDVKDFLPGDKNALIIAARILGYGADYKIRMTCPRCSRENEVTVDLAEFSHKEVDYSKFEGGNLFSLTLPNSKKTVKIKLVDGHDLEIVKQKLEEDESDVDHKPSYTLMQNIVEVEGNSDRGFIENFVTRDLFALDSKAIRAFIEEVIPDVNRNQIFKCNNESCKHSEPYTVPIAMDFFWPRV